MRHSFDDVIGIALTKGFMTWVSPEDADLSLVKWCVSTDRGQHHKAHRLNPADRSKRLLLHRVIAERMGLDMEHEVDHIDGDPLNNRRSNLRAATRSENQRNRGATRSSKSGVKGVGWEKNRHKWRARIRVQGQKIHLGYHDTIEAASQAYAAASVKYHGEFGRTK